jgi:hypothetical protein
VYTQEDHTHIPHKGPSPYYAMQNITITENGVYKLLRNIKPHKATGPNICRHYPLQWYTSSSGCSSDCSIT